jgi:hypothetical protein
MGSAHDWRWSEAANRRLLVIELCRYVCETLREDEKFALCRGRRGDGKLPTIVLVAPVSEYSARRSLERLEHEYALRDELDSDWAARPLALSHPGSAETARLLGKQRGDYDLVDSSGQIRRGDRLGSLGSCPRWIRSAPGPLIQVPPRPRPGGRLCTDPD